MLTVAHLTSGYGKEDILHDISFSLERGDFFAILGPNGCGKTTLLRALIQLLPIRGTVRLGAQNMTELKRRDIARHISVLSQSTQTYFPYTVYETVEMGRYLHTSRGFFDSAPKQNPALIDGLLETFGLSAMKHAPIATLSGGQLQRVYLARALASEPSIILLDEPTNHLDLSFQIELLDYLSLWVKQEARGIIAVMHDLNLALRYCNKALLLKDGRIHACGDTASVLNRQHLEAVYGVDLVSYMQNSYENWIRQN